jgi:hypothetical protein
VTKHANQVPRTTNHTQKFSHTHTHTHTHNLLTATKSTMNYRKLTQKTQQVTLYRLIGNILVVPLNTHNLHEVKMEQEHPKKKRPHYPHQQRQQNHQLQRQQHQQEQEGVRKGKGKPQQRLLDEDITTINEGQTTISSSSASSSSSLHKRKHDKKQRKQNPEIAETGSSPAFEESLRQQREYFAALEAEAVTASLSSTHENSAFSRTAEAVIGQESSSQPSEPCEQTNAAYIRCYDPILDIVYDANPGEVRAETSTIIDPKDFSVQSYLSFREGSEVRSKRIANNRSQRSILNEPCKRFLACKYFVGASKFCKHLLEWDEVMLDGCDDCEFGRAWLTPNSLLIDWRSGKQTIVPLMTKAGTEFEKVLWVRTSNSSVPRLAISLSEGNDARLYIAEVRPGPQAAYAYRDDGSLLTARSVSVASYETDTEAEVWEDSHLKFCYSKVFTRNRILEIYQSSENADVTVSTETGIFRLTVGTLQLRKLYQSQYIHMAPPLIKPAYAALRNSEFDESTIMGAVSSTPSPRSVGATPATAFACTPHMPEIYLEGLRNGHVVLADNRCNMSSAIPMFKMDYRVDHMQFFADGATVASQDCAGTLSLYDIRRGSSMELYNIAKCGTTRIREKIRFWLDEQERYIVSGIGAAVETTLHWFSVENPNTILQSMPEIDECFHPLVGYDNSLEIRMRFDPWIKFPSLSCMDRRNFTSRQSIAEPQFYCIYFGGDKEHMRRRGGNARNVLEASMYDHLYFEEYILPNS